jgi:hypothetical protein
LGSNLTVERLRLAASARQLFEVSLFGQLANLRATTQYPKYSKQMEITKYSLNFQNSFDVISCCCSEQLSSADRLVGSAEYVSTDQGKGAVDKHFPHD